LEADERGEGSCRVLAKRFGVSWEYVRGILDDIGCSTATTRGLAVPNRDEQVAMVNYILRLLDSCRMSCLRKMTGLLQR